MSNIEGFEVSVPPEHDAERQAIISQEHGFYIRHPPKPHLLSSPITSEDELFQTIHMGTVEVDKQKWLLIIDGLVKRPFAVTFEQLLAFPTTEITSFHECFGSPLTPPTIALWRVGNVTWTGVSLRLLLSYAQPLPPAQYVWSEGLDSGVFANVYADRYQKDLPLSKALCPEVLVAYKMNGEWLGKERGGPVRLVVPGWFGTNSTKWLGKLSLQEKRAPGPYTTRFYNIKDLDFRDGRIKPVWEVDVNSMIVRPAPNTVLTGREVDIEGWSWSHDSVIKVEVTSDGGNLWTEAQLEPRKEFSWQKFSLHLRLTPGSYTLIARATSRSGKCQAMCGWRNHVHSVDVRLEDA